MSSDVYCQSINDNHFQTSCAFYVKSIQVNISGELGRKHSKRERDIADWGERERVAWVSNRGQHLVDFDRLSKST
jgi:hypothetical protein